ncbi:MAG: hypothetical protein M3Q40_04805 [Pseudomonadota bacterium]|nr:hypothetical protein [Pseudomonadota bacterium]
MLEPIPYPDGSFGSVSAYDFLEHVPRIFPSADGRATVFPFVVPRRLRRWLRGKRSHPSPGYLLWELEARK